jgi:flagellar assembly protein FliH
MTQIRKHTFTTEFSPDGAIVRNAPKRLSSEEIAAECAAAYERGKRDAIALAERQSAAALEALAGAASAALTRLDEECRAMRAEAAHVALAAARKIASAALDAFGAERAIAAIEAAMEALRHQPRLLIKLSPHTAETLRPRVEAMCATHAYAGAILLRSDAALSAGEVSIDWSDGVIIMNSGEIAERISALIDAALANP